jgi:hypothetical protein
MKDVEWFQVVQVRFQWRALVNTTMNFLIPYMVGNVFSTWTIIDL